MGWLARHKGLVAAVGALVLASVAGVCSCQALRRGVVKVYPQSYEAEGDPARPKALFVGKDEQRARLEVRLSPVAKGLTQPTAVEFVPDEQGVFVALEKTGAMKWGTLEAGLQGQLLSVEVTTASEQGLLGLAFHPRFATTRRFFLNYTAVRGGKEVSLVEEWRAEGSPFAKAKLSATRLVLELEQPYANHNGGHLAFGPDGHLYIGFGDGGYRDDPHEAGQRLDTLLGKMLRLDVDAPSPGRGYAVPKDNPFVGTPSAREEIWALGLRNPWRYAFDPKGRLVVADVGQDAWEEVSLLAKGDNLGWNLREGRHCFSPKTGCRTGGLREPFFDYGRDDGQSVTGGVVALADGPLRGKYVFGDFISGRLWALDLPDEASTLVEPVALGKWPILPSSFGRDAQGRVYVLDFGQGQLLRVEAARGDQGN